MNEVRLMHERPVRPEAVLDAANKAYNANCGTQRWLLNWDWRFNPEGAEGALGFYIQKDGDIASFVAVSPLKLIVNQTDTLKAGLAIMGLTHPSYQGQGLYSKIYRYAEETVRNLGYDCLIAFDNHNSHYPEVKYLNWRDIGLLTSFTIKWVDFLGVTVASDGSAITAEIVDDNRLKAIGHYHTNNSKYAVQRDYEYLKWRFLKHPLNKYFTRTLSYGTDILACLIYKHYQEDSIDVMEVFYQNDDTRENLLILGQLLGDLAREEKKNINVWSNLTTAEHLFLEKIGFEERCFSAYFVCNPLKMDHSILDMRNWHYRFMDSDVY